MGIIVMMKTYFTKPLFIIALVICFAMPIKIALAVPAWLVPAAY